MTLFIGIFRLGRDAELRHTQSGEAVCNLALAANYGKPGDDGKRPVQWVDASLFGKRAEALAPHMLKGTSLFCSIEDVHVETFEKKDGTTATSLRGRVNQIEFASPKSEAPAPAPAPRQQQPQSQGGYRSSEPRRAPAPRQQATGTGFDDLDSEIPF